jgi:hypothetical protein
MQWLRLKQSVLLPQYRKAQRNTIRLCTERNYTRKSLRVWGQAYHLALHVKQICIELS